MCVLSENHKKLTVDYKRPNVKAVTTALYRCNQYNTFSNFCFSHTCNQEVHSLMCEWDIDHVDKLFVVFPMVPPGKC